MPSDSVSVEVCFGACGEQSCASARDGGQRGPQQPNGRLTTQTGHTNVLPDCSKTQEFTPKTAFSNSFQPFRALKLRVKGSKDLRHRGLDWTSSVTESVSHPTQPSLGTQPNQGLPNPAALRNLQEQHYETNICSVRCPLQASVGTDESELEEEPRLYRWIISAQVSGRRVLEVDPCKDDSDIILHTTS